MAESRGIVYCNGDYVPVGEASIPILDPAFTKSDVVFDAVSVWDGQFFRLGDHLGPASKIQAGLPCETSSLSEIVQRRTASPICAGSTATVTFRISRQAG